MVVLLSGGANEWPAKDSEKLCVPERDVLGIPCCGWGLCGNVCDGGAVGLPVIDTDVPCPPDTDWFNNPIILLTEPDSWDEEPGSAELGVWEGILGGLFGTTGAPGGRPAAIIALRFVSWTLRR